MELMTHLAAIAVGVVIALLFVGFGKSSKEEPALTEAPAKTNAAKKKNKKKNKKKAKPAATPKPETPKPPAPVKEPPKVEAPKVEPPAPAPAPAPPANGGKKKKKNGATANGTATPAAAPTKAPSPVKAAPPAKTLPPPPAIVPLQPRIVVEEAWETIPKKSKKKKNSGARKQQQAEAGATASAAATESKVTVSVTINASRVGVIIGPKGATMNAIQEKTGTKLDVNAPKPDEKASGGNANQFRPVVGGRSKNTTKATVVISEGSPEAQQAAKKAILELADRGYATLLQAEGFGESSVAVHPRFLSEIVGTGGKIIKAIQSELDVKLTIPKTEWTPKSVQIGNVEPSVRVGIAGDSPANVKQAKQVIKDICAYHHHSITHPGMVHQEVFVPQEFFHCVIGTRGSEIKHIRGNYNVDVYMPSGDSWSVTENVICVGKPNDVEKAISYIKLLMDRDSELREQKYSDEAYGDDSYGW